MQKRTYLDYAATAPLRKEAAEAMLYFMQSDEHCLAGYNANSLHSEGRESFSSLESSRYTIASALGIRPHELVFTAGATESNNAALFGIVSACSKMHKAMLPHVITSTIEHDSVYLVAKELEARSLARVSFIAPKKTGHIDMQAIEDACTDETVLLSLMSANNETGAVQDIKTCAEIAHSHNALFHTDAVQVFGKLVLNLHELNVDAASFSAHKIGGPKGVGLLYLKSKCPFNPLLLGGGQEGSRRSGTQNVCGIAGFAAAVKASCENEQVIENEAGRLRLLRDMLYEKLCAIDGIRATVPCEKGSLDYLPHIVDIVATNIESETLILQLDMEGFAVSGGSACSSHSLDASRVLLEMGIQHDEALGALRISLGYNTSKTEVECFAETFSRVYQTFQRKIV